jgi:hypothetical protein
MMVTHSDAVEQVCARPVPLKRSRKAAVVRINRVRDRERVPLMAGTPCLGVLSVLKQGSRRESSSNYYNTVNYYKLALEEV